MLERGVVPLHLVSSPSIEASLLLRFDVRGGQAGRYLRTLVSNRLRLQRKPLGLELLPLAHDQVLMAPDRHPGADEVRARRDGQRRAWFEVVGIHGAAPE